MGGADVLHHLDHAEFQLVRRLIVAVALTASLSLSGCETVTALIGGHSIAEQAPAAALDAEKALTIANLAYQGIGLELKDAAERGMIHGENAATAKVWYDQAGDTLLTAHQLNAVANAQGVMDAVSKAQALIFQIKSLIPK